jgi:hypothetical protein
MNDDHIPAPAEHSPRKTTHIRESGTATIVIGEGETIDEMQASGSWIESDTFTAVIE